MSYHNNNLTDISQEFIDNNDLEKSIKVSKTTGNKTPINKETKTKKNYPNKQIYSKSFMNEITPKFQREINDDESNNENNLYYLGNDEIVKTIKNSPRSRSFDETNIREPKNHYLKEAPFKIFGLNLYDDTEGSDDDEDSIDEKKQKKSSSIATSFSIWSCMIGSGLLSIPWAVKDAGIIPTIVFTIVYGLMMWYTAYIYVKTGLHAKDFSDTVANYFGRKYGFIGRILQIAGATLITVGATFVFFLIIK